MTRHAPERTDSLEMLLDTMCNTFGGIILVSLLIALLSRAAPAPEPAATEAEPMDPVAPEYADAIQQFQTLNQRWLAESNTILLLRQIEQAHRQFDAAYSQPVSENVATELDRTRKTNELLLAESGRLKTAIGQIQSQRGALSNRPPVTISRPPILGDVSSRAHGEDPKYWLLVLWGGQAYPIQLLSGSEPLRNEAALSWLPSLGPVHQFRVTPVPGRGWDATRHPAAFQQHLDRLSPELHVIKFLLYADSFAQFDAFRQTAVQKGFRYDITFYAMHEPLTITYDSRPAAPVRSLN